MEILGVDAIKAKSRITEQDYEIPYTFFGLDSSEQLKYNTFRVKHDKLTKSNNKRKDKGIGTKEREDGENDLSEMFLDLVNPIFQKQGLKAMSAFSFYGKPRETIVKMPDYRLFDGDSSFDSVMKFFHWFTTEDEILFCRSYFEYEPSNFERNVVYDSIRRISKGKQQDSVSFPLVSFTGNNVNFASTDFTLPLMNLVKEIIEKIGIESMDELRVIYREYYDKCTNYDESSGNETLKCVLGEAYEGRLERELIRAGFIEKRLSQI